MSSAVLSINQCLKQAEGVIECTKDTLKLARSNKAKRNAKFTIEFFEAISYHLNNLKNLKETKDGVINDISRV